MIKLRIVTGMKIDGTEYFKIECKRIIWPFWINIVFNGQLYTHSWMELLVKFHGLQLRSGYQSIEHATKAFDELKALIVKIKFTKTYRSRVIESVSINKETAFIEKI
jgi:hypothetical protein